MIAQEVMTPGNNSGQPGRGMSKVAFFGILAFALVGLVFVFATDANHATPVSDTEGLEDVVSLIGGRRRRRKTKTGPDYEICKDTCGKLAVGCKTKSAAYKVAAKAKAKAAEEFCNGKCAITKFTKDTKTGLETFAGKGVTGAAAGAAGASAEALEDVADAINGVADKLIDTRKKVLNFEAKIKRKICLTKCFSKATKKGIHKTIEDKKPEMICYYSQSKIYAVEKVSEELDKIYEFTTDWVDTTEAKIKTKITDVTQAFQEKVQHIEEGIITKANKVSTKVIDTAQKTAEETYEFLNKTAHETYDLMMDVTTEALNTVHGVLVPVYEEYQMVKAGVAYLKEEVENAKHCINEQIEDAKMIASLPSHFSAAQETVLAFPVRGLVIVSLSIALAF